jgi:hypothetical protein
MLESGNQESRKKWEVGGGGSSGSGLIPSSETRSHGSVGIITIDGIRRERLSNFESAAP